MEKEKEKSNVFELKVVQEFRLSEETQEHLHRMYTLVLDNPNTFELAFSNFATSPLGIIITDYKGQFIEKIGSQGRGPGEIQSARYFGFDTDNNIVILDKTGAFFMHFNRKTKEVSSYEYPIKQGISVTSRNLQMCEGNWYLAIQLLGKPTCPHIPTVGVFNSKFALIDTLGGYDPFFQGRTGIMQETEIKVDCQKGVIFTAQGKVPYIQVFSMRKKELLGRTNKIPPSFMLSDKFITMVTNPHEMTRYLSEEQSLSLHIAYSEEYIFHIFRNERNKYSRPRVFNDSDHFVAVYDRESLEYVGEAKLPGAVLGSTKKGELIVLSDERNYEIQFLKIEPNELEETN